jgi:heparanase
MKQWSRAVSLGFATSVAALLVHAQTPVALRPEHMKAVGEVDPRFQSYNVEMIEITGGRFWAPYKQAGDGPAEAPPASPAEMPASLYRYRPPVNLADPRLRKLASALGPAYVRVSGTWANSTYFHDSDDAPPPKPPQGFNGVLTRAQWRGVIDFAHAVNAEIVTSFAVSQGVRDPSGVWTPVEAEKFLRFTRDAGGEIAAAEMFNEPTFAAMGGAPKGYDEAAYGRDARAFHVYLKKAAPQIQILGPGSLGEANSLGQMPGMRLLHSEEMLKEEGPDLLDAFSYHFYGGVSERCARMGASHAGATPEAALSGDWLSRTDHDEAFYAGLRDRFAPGKPIWLTETGETACGGDPWASDFIDSFRYLNQLGTLARHGVKVVMQNTLDASDYALIDESTLRPHANYWSALVWRRLMGTVVLDPGPSGEPGLYVYAHCLRDHPGGVAILAINADRQKADAIKLPKKSIRYTLSSGDLMSPSVELNGVELAVGGKGDLPPLEGTAQPAGQISLAPASITFFAAPKARNRACR